MQATSETNGGLSAIWGASQWALRVQIAGAATAVGRELACQLLAAGHPASNLSLVAIQPHQCSWHGRSIEVAGFDAPTSAADVLLLCSNHPRALEQASLQMARGTRVMDLAGCYRGRKDVPIVSPGTGLSDPGVFTQLFCLPHRSAALAAPALWALESAFGLDEVHVVLLCCAAGEGARGILELRGELSREGRKLEKGAGARVGNVLPVPTAPRGPGFEREMEEDLARLVGRPDLPIDVTALRVDAERCDSLSVHVHLTRPADAGEAAQVLATAPEILVVPDAEREALAPRTCQGSERLHVGRIRTGSRGPGSLCFFAVGDQLRVGAARAALQVAARFAIQ